jgi:predicted glycosyltransferase
MARGIFFSESIWGVGHTQRLGAIAEACGEIDLFHAGPARPISASNVHYHELPSLFQYQGLSKSNMPDQEQLGSLVEERYNIFSSAIQGEYDFYVIEMFPFAKEPLLLDFERHVATLRATSPQVKIYSSFRGYHSLDPTHSFLLPHLKFFDGVLVHSDPKVIRLEQSYPGFDFGPVPITYTGFVTRPYEKVVERERKIVVSFGGGHQAKNVLSLLPVLQQYRDYDIEFYLGPYCPEEVKKQITFGRVYDFVDDFRDQLATAALSISMGGYNTLMDLLQTKTPALVIRGASDQKILPKILADRGLLSEVDSKEMEPDLLQTKIQQALSWSPPNPYPEIDFGGLNKSAQILTAGSAGPLKN